MCDSGAGNKAYNVSAEQVREQTGTSTPICFCWGVAGAAARGEGFKEKALAQ
jgi:hypothetical protein